ncbi:MAG: thioredoxin-like domain-containing protein [Chthoniobacterales bacterium]
MRHRLIVFFLLFAAAFANAAGPHPLTVKDLSLMLRSGYTPAAVERETALRHFIGPITPADETALTKAGASAALLAGLKSGAYAVPPGEVAAAQEAIAAETKRRAAQEEEARKSNTLSQIQEEQKRAAAAAAAPTIAAAPAPMQHALAAAMKGDLVTSKNGILSTFNDQPIENKKLIALYFSAHWCPPCRKFTPELVEFYNRVAPAHPEFEIVFVSADRAAPAMEAYMRDAQMPWPAINFAKVKEKESLLKYAGKGIPCLVVIDATGKVVSDTYSGTTYVGPANVVADLDRMFAPRTAAK